MRDKRTEPGNSGGGEMPPERSAYTSLDYQALLRRCLNKRDLARRLIDKTAERLPDDIAQARRLADAGQCDALLELAHSVKGAAANLAAEDLRASAEALEHAAAGNCLEDLPPLTMRFAASAQTFLEDVRS